MGDFQPRDSYKRNSYKKETVYGMFINFGKCQFAMNSVDFRGHSISGKGILPTVHNLQKILDFSLPKDADHLPPFLGMCSFYKKFVPDYSNLVTPLFKLSQKLKIHLE